MRAKKSDLTQDKSAPERRKGLSGEQIKELELAGGAEGGMKAGSAGGPGSKDQPASGNAGEPKTAPQRK